MPSIDYSLAPAWMQWIFAAIAILALAAAIYGFVRKGWPVLRRFVRTVDALDGLPDALDGLKRFRIDTAQSLADQDTKIAEIHHETHRNDGSSIKDSTVRLEADVQDLSAGLARVEKGVAGLYTRDEIDAKNQAISEELERTRPSTRKPRSTK